MEVDSTSPPSSAVDVVDVLGVWVVVNDVDRGHGVRELDLHFLEGAGESDGARVPVGRVLRHRTLENTLQAFR